MFYYYRLDNSLNPILESNFNSSKLLTDNDLVRYYFSESGDYHVLVDDNIPVSNTLNSGAGCSNSRYISTDECPEVVNVYFGTKNNTNLLSESQITIGLIAKRKEGNNITIEYGSEEPLIHWLAWENNTTPLTQHYINDLDQSVFGLTQTFSSPTVIGNYHFVQGNFATQIDFITFK